MECEKVLDNWQLVFGPVMALQLPLAAFSARAYTSTSRGATSIKLLNAVIVAVS